MFKAFILAIVLASLAQFAQADEIKIARTRKAYETARYVEGYAAAPYSSHVSKRAFLPVRNVAILDRPPEQNEIAVHVPVTATIAQGKENILSNPSNLLTILGAGAVFAVITSLLLQGLTSGNRVVEAQAVEEDREKLAYEQRLSVDNGIDYNKQAEEAEQVKEIFEVEDYSPPLRQKLRL